MKKVLTILALALWTAIAANAQIGIVGGFTSSKASIDKNWAENAKNVSLYHVGIAYKWDIGSFFAIQPAFTFQMKGATLNGLKDVSTASTALTSLDTRSGYLELNLGLQLGPDLAIFRPFLLLEPFIGYQVYDPDTKSISIAKSWDEAKNKFEVGFGVGGGIELFDRIQLSVQWFMNLGRLYNSEGKVIDIPAVAGLKNFQGVKVTVGLFL